MPVRHELSNLRERDGNRGLVKKPTGFMTSSRCVAAQLERQCNGQHDHVHLVGERASSAQVHPQPFCEAVFQGFAQQKIVGSGRKLITPKMNNNQLKMSVGSLAGVDTRKVASSGSTTAPIGEWSRHWVDPVHEEDGKRRSVRSSRRSDSVEASDTLQFFGTQNATA